MASIPARLPGNDSTREQRLNEVIAAYLEAIETGAAADRKLLLEREPELANELAAFFANQDHLDRLAGPPHARNHEPLIGVDPGSANDRTGPFPTILPYSAAEDPEMGQSSQAVRYFGDYELLRVIAQGGMGIVYSARQVSLNRILALKMVRAGRLASPEDLMRFRLEAEAAAHLDHPHIVPIYEVGEHEGHHYFSMKLIAGGNLADQAQRFHREPRAAARLMATVARAVHYAHQRGILHRDLKPANILLSGSPEDPPDRMSPMVADFGLAKRVEAPDSGGVTSSGSILGSPRYMAPEQAEGRRESITTAVDIHALGAIFYELLTGSPPFRGDSVLEILRQVREEEPGRPRSINPLVPRDLETIVLKCLEKSPQKRYHSAEALAADIDRWLANMPIQARPASPLERLSKWARRRPAAAGLIALAGFFSLATVLAIRGHVAAAKLQSAVAQTGQALDHETRKRVDAESLLVDMEDDTYFKQLIAAEQDWENNNPVLADELLDRCPIRLRGWEWHHLRRRFHSELQTFRGHDGFLCGISFKPDGSQVACTTETTGFLLWETSSDQLVRRIPGHDGTIYGLAFNRAGTRMASAEASGQVRIWDLTTGENLGVLRGHQGWVAGIAFADDGRMLASAGEDGTIRLWNVGSRPVVESEQPVRILQGHAGPVFGVAFSPDGSSLASAGHDGTVRLWDLRTGPAPRCRVFQGHQQAVRCVAFHPRQNVLASAGADRTVRLWDASTGRELLRFGAFGNRVDGIAFSPDGGRIATACLDRSVRLWDAVTGRPLAAFPGHAAPVFSVTFSLDGKKLASASQDSTVKVWDLTSESGVRLLSLKPEQQDRDPRPIGWVGGLAFRPDGLELATGGTDQALAVWHLATARATQGPTTGWGPLTAVRYSPDGRLLASAGADRKVHIRNAGSLSDTMVLEDDQDGLVSLAFNPQGSILATGGGDPLEVLQQPSGKVSPRADRARPVRLWDPKTGSPHRSLTGHMGSIHALVFNSEGTRLISAGADGLIRVWDTSDGHLLRTLQGHSKPIHALALGPDGRQLASAGADGSIKIWELSEGRLVRSLTGHTNWIFGLAFHPDGHRIASAGADGTVRLWETAGGREILTLRGHHDRVHGVAFSPDGTRLASASADGVVRLWETELRAELAPRN